MGGQLAVELSKMKCRSDPGSSISLTLPVDPRIQRKEESSLSETPARASVYIFLGGSGPREFDHHECLRPSTGFSLSMEGSRLVHGVYPKDWNSFILCISVHMLRKSVM